MIKEAPIIHEAITLNPDPAEFMPVEVNSAFPKGAQSRLTSEEKTTIDRLIEAVPDKNDTRAINYWVDMDDKKVYLEGWCDKCLAGTGFPDIGGGEWDEKIQYMIRVGNRTLIEKQEEKNRPIGLYPPGHLNLIEGGFREFEAGDRGWLYGVTWGVYEKIKEGNPSLTGEVRNMEHRGNPDGTEVYVEELPKCDFCDKSAHYDGKTLMGPWAHMCEEHFAKYGYGLGTGRGQKLIPRKALREAERLRGEPEKELSVTMTAEDLETAVVEDVWHPTCPYCGAKTPAEPDAHAVYCEACSRRFKIVNPFFSPGEVVETIRGETSYGPFIDIIYKEDDTYIKSHQALGRPGRPAQRWYSVAKSPKPVTWIGTFGTYEEAKRFYHPNPGAMDEIQAKAIAEEAAVKASELTGGKIAEQVAKEMSGELLHQSPVSPHCERVLEEPPLCYDFRGARSYTLCLAWKLMEEEKLLALPVGRAWHQLRRVCRRD